MTIYSDIFNAFADTNDGGSTFTRTINLVTPATAEVLVSFSTFGDYNTSTEFVRVSIEGFDLGPFLDNNADNDRFTNLDGELDIGDQYQSIFFGVGVIPAAIWAGITADGKIDVTYTLGPFVSNDDPGEFLQISFNDTPASPNPDAYAAIENAPLIVDAAAGVLANDGVPGGAIAVPEQGPRNGVLALNADGSFSYTPFSNFSGADSFTYRWRDGGDISNATTVSLTVATSNDAPRLAGTLKIEDLLTTNAAVVDHLALTGDDKGGIAVSGTQVFVTGDDATGRFGLDLSGGTALPAPEYDGLVSDLATGAVYVLGTSATTPLEDDTGVQNITHLLAVNGATGALTGASIALSLPIQVDTSSDSGVFSGAGRAAIYAADAGNTGVVYDIDLASGAVVARGSLVLSDLDSSESWAGWGVVEEFGGELYLAYSSDSTQRIDRIRVSDGTITTIAEFADLSDLASFVVSPTNNRWYFHHENASQFGGTDEEPDETLGYADALLDIQKPWDDATFAENAVNSAAQLIDSDMSLVDPDSDFAGGKITVAYASGGGFEDMLSVRNQGGGAGQIGFDGVNVSFGGVVLGTVTSNGAHGEDLVVTFQAGASVAAVEALLENLSYKNTSDTPAAIRTLSIVLDDGDGGVSAPVTSTITVTPEDEVGTGIVITGTKKNDTVDVDDTVNGQPLPTNFADTIGGGKGRDKLSGLGGNDTIDGGKDKDTLRGGDGDDLLAGGKDKDKDKLFGEAGEDGFLFNIKLKKQGNENIDKLKDFSAFDDLILLDDGVFKELAPGGIAAEAFVIGKKAKTDAQHIIYNDKNGELLYDHDGKGGDKAIVFAKVEAELTHLDFFVV